MKGHHLVALALGAVVLATLACGPFGNVNLPSVSEPTTEPAAVVTVVPTLLPSPVPEQDLPTATSQSDAQGNGKLLRQWASGAAASSEYGEQDWSAAQATGAPDTEGCGDLGTAWASSEGAGVQWIELTYAIPVRPTEVNIIETYNPDHIVKVEMISTVSEYVTVYEADPQDMGEDWCPYNLSIAVDADYEAAGLRITIDQTELLSWNEIDAVELVGYTADE